MAFRRSFFLKGGVKVQADGCGRERFFNIAVQRGLKICEVREKPKTGAVTFWTSCEDYKKMKPVARKAGVRLKLQGKYGLPFFLYRNRKRKLLAAGFFFFFAVLYTMSFFIWDISFEGNLRFTDETLLHYMESLPVAYGMKKADISCEDLEEAIRNEFPEITWVSAQITGTRLIVRVKENEAVLVPEEKDETPCDLAAQKGGVVKKIVMRSGICQVKPGDEVAAGDLLVSGTIPIYDDGETLVNSHEIHADAEIFAETVYYYEKNLPVTRTERARTGKVRKGLFLEAFGKDFYFLWPAGGEDPWEFVTEQHQLKLFDDFYLPVYGGIITGYEYSESEKTYTNGEVSRIAERAREEYVEKLSEKGIQILGDDDKIEKNESGWRIYGRINVEEDIAKEVPIPEKQEERQPSDEYH